MWVTIASLSDREQETVRVLGSRASQSGLMTKAQVPVGEAVSQNKVGRLLSDHREGRGDGADRQTVWLFVDGLLVAQLLSWLV